MNPIRRRLIKWGLLPITPDDLATLLDRAQDKALPGQTVCRPDRIRSVSPKPRSGWGNIGHTVSNGKTRRKTMYMKRVLPSSSSSPSCWLAASWSPRPAPSDRSAPRFARRRSRPPPTPRRSRLQSQWKLKRPEPPRSARPTRDTPRSSARRPTPSAETRHRHGLLRT